MQCERLKKLVRNWGKQIVEDALAPARMIEFVERHIRDCSVCQADSAVSRDPSKIRKMVTPFISARDPQKAARFEEILEAHAASQPEPEPEEEIMEEGEEAERLEVEGAGEVEEGKEEA